MSHYDRRCLVTVAAIANQPQHRRLMREIEICCRFIKQKDFRFSCERARNHGTLTLATGQFVHQAGFKSIEFSLAQDTARDFDVLFALPAPRARPCVASADYELQYRDGKS